MATKENASNAAASANKSRSCKATVGIETKAGKLRLRLPRSVIEGAGSLRYISTGLDNTTDNYKKAQVVAWAIEADIRAGTLDTTLERYKLAFRPKQQVERQPDILELWLAYVEYKRPQVAETTWLKNYKRTLTNHVQSLPSHKLTDASVICDYLLANASVAQAKRVLRYLSECCVWACKRKLISSNPFTGMAADIRQPKHKPTIQPFTAQERDSILAHFRLHQPHYLSFVSFMFLTGCRTGEAIGLRWANVAEDCTSLTFAESLDSDTKIRKSTKTGVTRTLPANSQLKQLMSTIARGKPDEPVFTNKKGRPIHNSVFVYRVWKPSLGALVDQGKLTSYKRLYNTRHTFISHCLEAGIPVTSIASWVGNSPEILMKHYAGIVSNHEVPLL